MNDNAFVVFLLLIIIGGCTANKALDVYEKVNTPSQNKEQDKSK